MTKLAALLVLQCTLCVTIRVPITWNANSDVNINDRSDLDKQEANLKVVPKEYFEYKAAKPQFAIDIATFHGVQSPEEHYSAYPVAPFTGARKPSLGYHQLLNPEKSNYHQYQGFVNKSSKYVKPASTFFDVYHPYKSEEPALQKLYKDPVLNKIRNDIRDSKDRLQKYESKAGEANIKKDEYLESPEQTDYKQTAHKNVPAQYEIHRPLRQSIYYRPLPKNPQRENILNHKLKHPWNQNHKVAPIHYRPVKNHLQRLRQQHALRYNDEHNEYPQLPPPESVNEEPEGYDIYENAKAKFVKLRNNVDESVNKAALESKESGNYKLELQDDEQSEAISDDHQDDEFVPVKNYAQVRKTETMKHLPRERAFQDAESYEDLINAPRLREAVKSTKAQIVYSEEGYEDSAYDHAGEHKHASDHEGHGGYLKEGEISRGKYKIPSVSVSHDEGKGAEYKDKVLHAKKWKNDDKKIDSEKDEEDYSEDEYEIADDADVYAEGSNTNEVTTEDKRAAEGAVQMNKSNNQSQGKQVKISKDNSTNSSVQHELNKREVSVVVPEINLASTLLTEQQIDNINKINHQKNKSDKAEIQKYPYYSTKDSDINKDSPLRYAENLNLIPKKTHGGTEFYNSRSNIECSEVEDDVDPVPEKLKTGESPDNDNDKENTNLKKKQRLKGLGNKIDCFKAKYFGENPLDSPFFKEGIIPNPNPLTIPNLEAFGIKYIPKQISPLEQSPRRRKRSTPFVYEPYKIIRESQVPDSKKTTTSSNIGPLIKQLQSSRVIDKTNSKPNSDQIVKKNTNSKIYKDIDKENRQKQSKTDLKDISDKTFVDVNDDQRQGEPRYELQHRNHKAYYTPVENKTSLSFQDYKEKMDSKIPTKHQKGDTDHTSEDEDEFEDDDDDEEEDDDEYEEYDSDEDDKNIKFSSTSTTTTTTTTRKPLSRKSITTEKPVPITHRPAESDDNDYVPNKPKLQLVTRFRNSPITKSDDKNYDESHNKYHSHESNIDDEEIPKYREKKKKLSKSTLVTDTKTYGEGDDDMHKEDIDKMIGVKQAAKDYMPSYEKEREQNFKSNTEEEIDPDDYYKIKSNPEDEDDEDEEDDDSEESEDDEDDDDEINHDDDRDDSENDATTPQPTKRTLPSTTEKIVTTTENLKTNSDPTSKILRKKIEIHKELPVNKSSPNITQYRQDIKEIEIIKEIPLRTRKKNQKNVEVLDLYKDINLAKDVNKLGGVEIFKENLDLKSGPRHGGNYRKLDLKKINYESTPKPNDQESNKDDVEASQSETNKYLEVDVIPASRRRKINRSQSNQRSPRNDGEKNAKLIELSEIPDKSMHGGNLKIPQSRGRVRTKNAKYIELEDDDKKESDSMHGGNFKSYGTKRNDMHGGNYRSERLRQAEDTQNTSKEQNDKGTAIKSRSKNNKNNAAVILNGYVRAMPILTTTPNYIVDPSKRKYYYVDA